MTPPLRLLPTTDLTNQGKKPRSFGHTKTLDERGSLCTLGTRHRNAIQSVVNINKIIKADNVHAGEGWSLAGLYGSTGSDLLLA